MVYRIISTNTSLVASDSLVFRKKRRVGMKGGIPSIPSLISKFVDDEEEELEDEDEDPLVFELLRKIHKPKQNILS